MGVRKCHSVIKYHLSLLLEFLVDALGVQRPHLHLPPQRFENTVSNLRVRHALHLCHKLGHIDLSHFHAVNVIRIYYQHVSRLHFTDIDHHYTDSTGDCCQREPLEHAREK